ncbi:hypothetical protein [Klebsiella pneumoniae]|nr:hypothetical protein [Klebsiella pneumoniae]
MTYNPPREYGSGWRDQVRYLDKGYSESE